MNKKFENILKLFSVILFVFLITNQSKVYATEIDQRIEMFYEQVEREDGIFYKRKKTDPKDVKRAYSISEKVYSEENKKVVKIIKEKIDEYMTRFTSDDCPEEQKIEKEYTKNVINIYSVTEENPYNDGDEIIGLISVSVTPINPESSYWKENFINNDIYYNRIEEKYHYYMNYYIRLVFNKEINEYEIAYIDFEPENLEEELTKLKEEKGFDLENLNVKDLMNISYDDEIKVVASSNTVATSANKTEYNTANVEEISNMAFVIRVIYIMLLILIIVIYIRKKCK